MAYSNVPIGTSNPCCVVILVDQSWSMSEDWGTGTKAERAAFAVNRILEELVIASRSGDTIKDRCHVSVIGYGQKVECVVDGMISDIASSLIEVKKVKKSIPDGAGGIVDVEIEMPVWVQPEANNGTPMHEAFERASDIVQRWCDNRPDSFPPTVINITDGAATQPDLTVDAARKVMNLHTTDGNALVFNIHIANNQHGINFPCSTDLLVDDALAEFLFSLSSVLPDPLREMAKEVGLPTDPDARCFSYNADEVTMIRILEFGSLGVTQIRVLPSPV